jgi:hypothetical protein
MKILNSTTQPFNVHMVRSASRFLFRGGEKVMMIVKIGSVVVVVHIRIIIVVNADRPIDAKEADTVHNGQFGHHGHVPNENVERRGVRFALDRHAGRVACTPRRSAQ